jgi:DNA-binding GntR family transcriptional regulator
MRDVFQAREAVEGAAVGLAAARATKEDVRRLREINELELVFLEQGAWENYIQANDDFHMTLMNIGGNGYLQKIFLPLYWRSQLYVHYLTKFRLLPKEELLKVDRPHVSPREHRGIIDAVEARDEVAARERAVEHLRATLSYRLSQDSERAAKIFAIPVFKKDKAKKKRA